VDRGTVKDTPVRHHKEKATGSETCIAMVQHASKPPALTLVGSSESRALKTQEQGPVALCYKRCNMAQQWFVGHESISDDQDTLRPWRAFSRDHHLCLSDE